MSLVRARILSLCPTKRRCLFQAFAAHTLRFSTQAYLRNAPAAESASQESIEPRLTKESVEELNRQAEAGTRLVGQLKGIPSTLKIIHGIDVPAPTKLFTTQFFVNTQEPKILCGKGGDKRIVRVSDLLSAAFIISIANTTNYATHRKRIFRRLREALIQYLRADVSRMPTRPMGIAFTPTLEALHAPWEQVVADVQEAYNAAKQKLEALPPTAVRVSDGKWLKKQEKKLAKHRNTVMREDNMRVFDEATGRAATASQMERPQATREWQSFRSGPFRYAGADLRQDSENRERSDRSWQNDIPRGLPRKGSVPGDRRKRPGLRGDALRAHEAYLAAGGQPPKQSSGMVKKMMHFVDGKWQTTHV